MGEKIITQLVPDAATRIVENITMVVPLKDLIKFWKSPEKEVKQQNILFFSEGGNNNATDDSNNIVFNIKDTKSYVCRNFFSIK